MAKPVVWAGGSVDGLESVHTRGGRMLVLGGSWDAREAIRHEQHEHVIINPVSFFHETGITPDAFFGCARTELYAYPKGAPSGTGVKYFLSIASLYEEGFWGDAEAVAAHMWYDLINHNALSLKEWEGAFDRIIGTDEWGMK